MTSALITEETRPRAITIGNGLLLALRGVNLTPGSEPEDMVSIRIWIEPGRIVSTRKRTLLSVDDILEALEDGRGPKDEGGFLVMMLDRLTWRMSNAIQDIEDQVDNLEDAAMGGGGSSIRRELADLRRQAITLRRYLAPQREAMTRLYAEPVAWINDPQRLQMREVQDSLIRHIEDLDAVRERAAVTQEEIISRMSEQLNQRMYVLSVIAALFLPLGFLTGLLGINVGGIPGANNTHAFVIFSGFLAVIIAIQVWIFRKNHWL